MRCVRVKRIAGPVAAEVASKETGADSAAATLSTCAGLLVFSAVDEARLANGLMKRRAE